MKEHSARTARPFNEGSDARLAGLPPDANPYSSHYGHTEHVYWARGWVSVHEEWGADSRWPVPPLPPLMMTTEAILDGCDPVLVGIERYLEPPRCNGVH